MAAAGAPRWQKLHPLTPVVLAGRSAVVLVLVNMLYIEDVLGEPGSLPSHKRRSR